MNLPVHPALLAVIAGLAACVIASRTYKDRENLAALSGLAGFALFFWAWNLFQNSLPQMPDIVLVITVVVGSLIFLIMGIFPLLYGDKLWKLGGIFTIIMTGSLVWRALHAHPGFSFWSALINL